MELRRFDPASGSYLVMSSIVLTEHNMVHAEPMSLGKFALAGPPLPGIRFNDRDTIAWDAVATAERYTIYRGELANLVDSDVDGLPDLGYGDCRSHLDPDVTDTEFVDTETPAAGFFYVVGFFDGATHRGLGNTSQGLRRSVMTPCP